MSPNSKKKVRIIKNAETREGFERILKDPNKLVYWKKYVFRRIEFSIISKHKRHITEDDILSKLQNQIYFKNLVWNKTKYATYQKFMYAGIQNIIRNMERCLTIRYEKVQRDEESGKKVYDAKPVKPGFKEESVEINPDRIGKVLNEGEDRFAYNCSIPKKELNREKFRETVKELLGDIMDTDMLAIFTGMMEGKERNEIMAEYGMEVQDFDNARRRMLYKLKRELPVEYLKEYSTENNYLKNLALRKKSKKRHCKVFFLEQVKDINLNTNQIRSEGGCESRI
jgi:hypothetical protein